MNDPSEFPAILPAQGEWIVLGAPEIEGDVVPDGESEAHPNTPILIRFNETLAPDTVAGAFELVPDTMVGPVMPVVLQESLVGNGRALVLLPSAPLDPGDYVVRRTSSTDVIDLTGDALALASGAEVARFTVTDTPATNPSVIGTFPAEGATGVGDTGEIVVVFDRPVLQASVTDASFSVQVNGADPASDPPPQPATVAGVADTRVFRYRSVDGSGTAVPFAEGGAISLALSAGILDQSMAPLTATTRNFTVTPFATPSASRFASDPPDAIGLRNLTQGDPNELTLAVDLGTNRVMGDQVVFFMIGTNNPDGNMDETEDLIALRRVVGVDAALASLEIEFSEIDPTLRSAPIVPRLLDGAVSFAFHYQRGTMVSPLTVMDIDPVSPGIQDPLQDTERPSLMGSVSIVRSDQGGLVITGQASEPLRRVEITSTELGDNGTGADAAVIGSGPDGSFIARPIGGGILIDPTDMDSTVSFSLSGFDQALNRLSTGALSGVYTQVGGVGGSYDPGDMVDVEVFDAVTLEALESAAILVHGDDGDDIGFPFHGVFATDAEGRATITTPTAPSVGTLLTIDLAGYDLFTFAGIPADTISIPLTPVGLTASASALGEVTSEDSVVSATLRNADKAVGDTRRPDGPRPFFEPANCNPFSDTLSCPFGPEAILPGRLGAQTLLSGDFAQSRTGYNPVLAIEAFELVLPVPTVAGGESQSSELSLPFLLTDARAGTSELPVELPQLIVDASAITGLDVLSLVPDPISGGDLRVSVESLAPGLEGPVPTGIGQAFADAPDVWTVRSSRPGAVGSGGFFENNLDPDPYLRVELTDASGNRSVRRERVSAISGTTTATRVPQLSSPAPGGGSGGASYNLVFDNTIPGGQGLYEARLEDSAGRGWSLWRLDEPGSSGSVVLHVPDLVPGGGTALSDGGIGCVLRSHTFVGFQPDFFLWSEIARERELFAESAQVSFDQP